MTTANRPMIRKTATVGAAYVSGLFIASWASAAQCCIIMFAAAGVGFVAAHFFDERYCFVITLAFVFASGLYASYLANEYRTITAYDGSEIVFTGKVREADYLGDSMYSLTLRGDVGGYATDISFYTGDIDAQYGDTVTLQAKVALITDSVKYQSEKYSAPKGQLLQGEYAKVLKVSGGGFSLAKVILAYRDRVFDIITETLPGDEGAFLAAMLCGDKSQLDGGLQTALYRAGIGHIFSVSGMHLVVIAFAVMWLLDFMRLGRRVKFAVTETVIIMFVVFAGGSVSVIRAALMMSIMNLAKIFNRRYDCLTAILISVMIMTLLKPYAIRSSSLLLSAGGAFSFGVAAPKAVRAVKTYRLGAFSALAKSFMFAATVSVVTLPLNIMFFDEISLIAAVTNMLLAPLFTLSLTLAAAVMFTGGFITFPLYAAGAVAKKLIGISYTLASLPFSSVGIGYKSVKTAALLCWAFAVLFIIFRRKIDKYSVAAAALSFVCFVLACAVNYIMLKDVLRIYSIKYRGSEMAVVVLGGECAVVNISGEGELTQSAARLCNSKDVRKVTGFYDLEDTTTAYPQFAEYFMVGKTDVTIGGESVTFGSGSQCFTIDKDGIALDSGAYVIYVYEDGETVYRRLSDGFSDE